MEAGAAARWEQQASFGYKTGIAVSTFLPEGKQFMIRFDRDERLPTDKDELAHMLATLQLAAAHAQQAALRLLVPPAPEISPPELTRRELEILEWKSAGKTAAETAQILCISRHTVTIHARALLAKLNATSKHQAVLTALKHRLI